MTRPLHTLPVLLLAAAARAADPSLSAGVYGDARWAAERSDDPTQTVFSVTLPEGRHNALTICGWFLLKYEGSRWMTTFASYAPEAVRRSNPSLVFADAQGFPTNLILSGAVSVPSFPWQPYPPGEPSSNVWPKGVYTVAGWSSNALTVTLGGQDLNLGPGTFNRNITPGPADSCVLSGSGPACIGIARTPAAQFFTQIDGVKNEEDNLLTADSIVTNEWKFCSWRIRLSETDHIYRSDMAGIDRADCLGQVVTNAMPVRARALDSRGIYTFGFSGLGGGYPGIILHTFDVRLFPRWLSDDELFRIHGNGVEEMARREMPRWK